LLTLLAAVPPLVAQDSAVVRRDSTRADTSARAAAPDTTVAADTGATSPDTTVRAVADTAGRRSKPAAALWRSLVLPGWGQIRLGRKLTAGVFVLAEGLTLGMALKANSELQYLRRTGADSASVNAKSQTREDWLVLMGVNHLLAGLEAYIAANLTDFPPELRLRRGPGWFGASVTLPVRLP
jgi:hypothetical protein